ncbi:MAG TPA: glycosyltransferase family 4 protein [Gemmatimonadaceae bacterium]
MTLRSLHIDAGRNWRGGQRQVLLLTTALRARGREPLVVGVSGSPLLERIQGAGIATASIPMRSDWDLRSAKRLRSIIRAWRPDVLHAHDARAHAISLIALAGDTTPLVVTRRVTFPLKSVRVKYGLRVTRFIAISNAVRDAMVRSGVDSQRIDVVHSGVPTPVAPEPRDWRREMGWSEETVIAGVVGAMTAEKGVNALRHIASRLGESALDRTRLVLLGGTSRGPLKLGPLLAHQSGFVTEIHNAMAGLDVLWHPASEEGLGTVLIDSLGLGVPPIAFDVGGVGEIIKNGKNGLLVPLGDVQAFAAGHESMLEPGYRKRLAEAGPVRASVFSVEAMTEGVERVYQRVLTA